MPRPKHYDVETTVSTNLRAETSKIVSSVATFFEELEADSAATRCRSKRAKRRSRDTVNAESSSAVYADSAKEVLGEGEIKNGQPHAEKSAVEGRKNRVELPEVANLLKPKVSNTREMGNNGIASEDYLGGAESVNAEHRREQYCPLTTLDLPEIPPVVSSVGYTGVKQSSGEHFREVVEKLQEREDEVPSWNAALPSAWSCLEVCRDAFMDKRLSDSDQELRAQEPPCLLPGPRRLRCGWCETLKSSEKYLYDESSVILKKMIRANAQMLLLKKEIVVPSVFDADWDRTLYDMRLPQSSAAHGRELQQLLLPFDVVRRDDARVIDAPSKIVSLADSYLRSLSRPHVSLTRAAMNIPTVWNIAVATDRLAELLAEERPSMVPQPITPTSSSPAQRSLQLERKSKKADVSTPLSNTSVSESLSDSHSTQVRDGDRGIATQTDESSADASKLEVVAEDSLLSTDYFLSNGFLHYNWDKSPKEANASDIAPTENVVGFNGLLKHDQYLQQIARPALWDLMRKKLLRVDGTSIQHTLNYVSLEALEAIVFQQFQKVKNMSLNPSTFSSDEIVEVCTSLRQAAWLHTLRIVSISLARNGDMLSIVLARILASAKYKRVLGSSNWKELLTYLQMIDGNAVPLDSISVIEDNATAFEETPTLQPASKRQRVLQADKETASVRVLCSDKYLKQDELLDELCTEHQIFFVERDLPPPIDILVDERNCICVVHEDTFEAEANTRNFIFSLARLQIQLKKCWLVIALSTPPTVETEDTMNAFLAALVQFRIETQVLTSFSCEETGRLVRAVVDKCADIALNDHRILPRLWFERPFLLEEVSQFERFLVSTKILNHYAAQSLLHKISMDDLFCKSLDDLKPLVRNVLTDEQLELLWRLLQQDHGLNRRMQ